MAAQPSLDPNICWTHELEIHRGWLRKVLRCRISNEAAVDDCLQDIAFAIVKQNNKPVDPQKVPAWLYRLAVRQAVNYHRRAGRQKNLLHGYQSLGDVGTDPAIEPLEWLVHCEQQEAVHQAMQQLRPGDREILSLKYTEGWSYKQLASHLGVSTTTVEYRLVRAKKRMRHTIGNLMQGNLVNDTIAQNKANS